MKVAKASAAESDVPMESESPPTDVQPEGLSNEQSEKPVEPSSFQSVAHQSSSSSNGADPSEESQSQYGPMRRIPSKNGPAALYRPPAMREQDFLEMMKEVVQRLLEHATSPAGAQTDSQKRPLESPESAVEPPSSRARINDAEALNVHEALSVEEVNELCHQWEDPQVSIEVMLVNYLQKKTNKEIPHSNNVSTVQAMVDESKLAEWQTILDKQAVKVHYGRRAKELAEKHADRFIGSRFVITKKPMEENQPIDDSDSSTFRIKSRWCLQGHLDPDLDRKVQDGLLQSPTLSQMGRMLTMQLIASHGWDLQLGDIKGAFLEAGPLPARFRPLFAKQPAGGIPGLPPEAIIEVTGNVYGQNDAPLAWHRTFDEEACRIGWERSKFDPCLYFLREESKLIGVMGVHVDDTALGGAGKKFNDAVTALRARFPYRKWRCNSGEFCEAFLSPG